MIRFKRLLLVLFTSLLVLCTIQPSFAAQGIQAKDVPRLTVAQAQQLQKNEEITFIDTRKPHQWQEAKDKIPDAIRVTTYGELQAIKMALPADRAIITYCT